MSKILCQGIKDNQIEHIKNKIKELYLSKKVITVEIIKSRGKVQTGSFYIDGVYENFFHIKDSTNQNSKMSIKYIDLLIENFKIVTKEDS